MRGRFVLAAACALGCAHHDPAPAPVALANAAPAPPDARAPLVIQTTYDVNAPPPADTGDAVRQRISSVYMRQLARCYQQKLKQDPTVQGRIVLHLAIDERGRVTEGHATGTDDEIDHCIEDAMRYWTFDATGATSELELTINLVAN